MKMYNAAIVFTCVVLYTTLFGVGCWEANLARHHVPTSTSSPGFLHGYVYTIVASVTNILIGLTLLYLLGICRDVDTKYSTVYLACVVIIWGLVIFIGMVNHDIQTGPFQVVVIAQFVMTMCGLFIVCVVCIGFALLGTTYLNYKPPEPTLVESYYVQV